MFIKVRNFCFQDLWSYSHFISTNILFFFIITCILTRTPIFGSTMAVLGIERYMHTHVISPLPLVMTILLNTIFSYKDTSLCFLYIFIMYLNLLMLANGTNYLIQISSSVKKIDSMNAEIIVLLKFMIVFGYDLVVDVWSHSLWVSLTCFLLFRPIQAHDITQNSMRRCWNRRENEWVIWMACLFGLIGSDYHGRSVKYWIATSVFMGLCAVVFAFQYGIHEDGYKKPLMTGMAVAVLVCIFVIVLTGWTS
jgi:hypothetical protein